MERQSQNQRKSFHLLLLVRIRFIIADFRKKGMKSWWMFVEATINWQRTFDWPYLTPLLFELEGNNGAMLLGGLALSDAPTGEC